MSIKPIVKMGNPQLATPSLPIEEPNKPRKEIDLLIENMLDTMHDQDGVGIAAPQIGCNQRVIIFGFEITTRYPNENSVPYTVLINPVIKVLSDVIVDDWEGCLSVPGLRGLVPRYNHIEYSGYNEQGHFLTRVVEGFHARVVQHECDHLDGILYPQRIKDMRFFGFQKELLKI